MEDINIYQYSHLNKHPLAYSSKNFKIIYIYQFGDSNKYQIVEEVFEGFEKVKILYADDKNYSKHYKEKYTLETKWIKEKYIFPFDMNTKDVINTIIKENSIYFI